MKEIIEAISTRIRSPILGYFSLSFLAVNWKAMYILLFSNDTALNRILYFDNNTSLHTLLTAPLLIAAGFALIYPWINLAFLYLTRLPTDLKNNLQALVEHSLILRELKLEELRNKYIEKKEINLIERAKRDQEIEEIDSKNLNEEIKRLRAEINEKEPGFDVNASDLLDDQIEIIRILTVQGGSTLQRSLVDASPFDKVKTEYYIEDLLEKNILHDNYLSEEDDYLLTLTTSGKKIAVDKGFAS